MIFRSAEMIEGALLAALAGAADEAEAVEVVSVVLLSLPNMSALPCLRSVEKMTGGLGWPGRQGGNLPPVWLMAD